MITIPLPCRMLIAGSSGCGKSTFVADLMKHREKVFDKKIEKIIYCAKFKTSIPSSLKDDSIMTFHEGCPTEEMLENVGGKIVFFIIDDLLESCFSSTIISQLFTQGRNRGISTCLLSQNLFPQYARARNISLNSNYLVVFRNHRDSSSINNLSRQVQPLNSKAFSDMFINSVEKPYSYLFLDFSPNTPQAFRFSQDIFKDNHIIYAIDDEIEKLKQGCESSGIIINIPEIQ